MTNPIILEPDYQLLKSLIGKFVAYAVLPDLEISSSHSSCLSLLMNNYQCLFYHASPISFCILNDNDWKDAFWLALDAGPDAPGEPWAPFAAWKTAEPITTCLSGEMRFPDGWVLKGQEKDERPARLHLWSRSPIIKIVVHRIIGEYAAMICTHADGYIWSTYAEYDRMFWLSFNKEVAEAIEAESDDYIVIT